MSARRLLVAAIAATACEQPTGIPFPPNAVPFSPPSVYREWWTLTEECSGRQGSYDAISWWVLPNAVTLPGTDGLNAAWFDNGNRIIIAGGAEGIEAGDLVRHEMLHALLRNGSHPRDMFVQKCGGVVVCIDECLTDAGPAPPPDVIAKPESASVLTVSVEVLPASPSSATWDGYFMMIIRAQNPAAYPILVQLPPSGDAGPPVSFHYRLEQRGLTEWYGEQADVPEVTRFAPGEVKQFIYDFHNVRGRYTYDLGPGTWTFHGAYGPIWAPSAPVVTIAP